MARASPGIVHVQDDVKVKAHVDPDNVSDWDDKWRAMGNNAADEAAVRAKSLHPRPPLELARKVDRQRKQQARVARVIGEVLSLWPTKRAQHQRLPVMGPARPMTAVGERLHEWVRHGQKSMYRKCLYCPKAPTNSARRGQQSSIFDFRMIKITHNRDPLRREGWEGG